MSAVFSPCRQYRYRLDREIDLASRPSIGTVAFFGVNPSVANETNSDFTVTKWTGFAQRWGYGRFIVGNMFPHVSQDIKGLIFSDEHQRENHRHIRQIIAEADLVVACWGTREKVPARLRPYFDLLMPLLLAEGKPVKYFGPTSSGDPKHVQPLGYDTPLIPVSS